MTREEALEAISPMLPRSLTTTAHGDPAWTEAIRKVEDAIAKAKRRQVEWRRKERCHDVPRMRAKP